MNLKLNEEVFTPGLKPELTSPSVRVAELKAETGETAIPLSRASSAASQVVSSSSSTCSSARSNRSSRSSSSASNSAQSSVSQNSHPVHGLFESLRLDIKIQFNYTTFFNLENNDKTDSLQ